MGVTIAIDPFQATWFFFQLLSRIFELSTLWFHPGSQFQDAFQHLVNTSAFKGTHCQSVHGGNGSFLLKLWVLQFFTYQTLPNELRKLDKSPRDDWNIHPQFQATQGDRKDASSPGKPPRDKCGLGSCLKKKKIPCGHENKNPWLIGSWRDPYDGNNRHCMKSWLVHDGILRMAYFIIFLIFM